MKKKNVFLVIFLLATHVVVFAQNAITVSGVVSEANGQPLPGATVLVKGTSIGTQTDFDGNYVLDNVPSDGTLVFSYIGFTTVESEVNNQNTINVSLQEDTQRLDEVVIVGYGEQKRSDITGAVVSVKAEEIVKIPALTATQSIQGKVAGVNIIASDAPGATPTVVVRGLGTALGGREPFFVVDGQPLQDIRSINPADIESIEFLKGASYANIYGIRAANGVILVTTKKGKKGKIQFNFDSFFGIRSVLNRVEMANGAQYTQFFNEENAAIGGPQLQLNQRYDTDWYDELLQTGSIQSHNFSVSGASDKVNYFLSYNFYDEEGILEGNTFSRGNIRSNNTFHLFDDKFRIIQNLNITYTNENPKSFGAFNTAFRQSPLVPVRYDNGRFGQSFYNQTTGIVGFEAADGESIGRLNSAGNPIGQLFFDDVNQNTTTLQGQITAEVDITKNLKATGRFGATQGFVKRNEFDPIRQRWLNDDPVRTEAQFEEGRADLDGDGIISTEFANNRFTVRDEEFFRWNVEGFLTFDKSFNQHNVSATVGLSRENFGGREIMEAEGFDVFDEPRLRNLNLRTSAFFDNTVTQEFNQSTNLQSYFARAEYDYAEKYFVRAVIRRDGTSDFIDGKNFFDNFPAFSVGWTLTEEDFLKDNELVDFLKIFGGWGQLGNANVPINVQQIRTDPDSGNQNYVFGPTQDLIFGASFGSPVFPLQWEVTEEWEAGFDFAMLDRKLSGTLTYYDRVNTNAILNVQPLLNSVAEDDFNAQAAEVSNSGVEVLVNWRDQIGPDFSYNVGVNFSTNRNRVENVETAFDGEVGGSLNNGQITKRLQEGQPIFAWWLLEADGVWQNQEEIDNNPSVGNARPGHLRYVDQNDDGVIDDRDKRFFDNYLPTFNYGITIGAQYKNFDFSLDGFGVGGNKVYNGLANTRLQSVNISEEVFNSRWTGEGSTNTAPGADRDALASSFWLEDGDFFRINNITIGYTFNQMGFLDRARLYFTAQNPFMFTNYSGFTPELNQSGTDAAGNPTFGNPRFGTGIELNAYPTTRTFILGLNVQI
ncbi:TonB-dependent receptor [Muricauda sp. SCSIO 64092]|uniref:SusC/RagA family TonB-linked outer membrane protein n=1 Tax=Allomuricauda sp. SCSIO 64092 TaxID=2908842 RepID=UPI001FF28E39|nr:TonB-dependent receptor [Muricauda sp. SCSIO 64092]UOY05850.1 TonB-dependent receptor [Muricauda sp. SCSIO 64092]